MVVIMSTGKTTSEELVPADEPQVTPSETVANRVIRLLSLDVEEDDAGGDPYNRTGQFCKIDIRDREE